MDFKKVIIKELEIITKVKHLSIEVPPDPALGDFAFPCFQLAKTYKKSPQQIAEEISKKIKLPFLEKIETKGPYLNFFIDKNKITKQVIDKVLKEKEDYGSSRNKSENVMVEFSQANTHKAFHVGHIRGTSLGESLARILEFTGKDVTRANYQGDTGMHVAKWVWCYQKYHSKQKIKQDETWFAKIYVDAIKKLAEKPELEEEVKAINQKLDEKSDPKLNKLWEETRKLCLESLEDIYQDLNTRFDKYFFESELEQEAKDIAKELLKNKVAEISDGATIVNLEKFNLGVFLMLRNDGTVLYGGKDIALAAKKFRKFKINSSIYVVGKEQEHYFMQVFKVLELMKFKEAKNCKYVPVSLVKLPWGKMSSRTGDNILYSSFKEDLIDYAKKQIKKRYKSLSQQEIDHRALAISIATIKYSMLKQSPNKEITFNKEEALNFEGDTGPYLQYSYARATSILKKSKKKPNPKVKEVTDKEALLIKTIETFPDEVKKAADELNPAVIANYAFKLSQTFNEFYTSSKVIGEKEETFRLTLVDIFRTTLKNSLNLLGIDVLEQM